MLQAEADITNETLQDLAQRIVETATAYRVVAAKIAGLRRSTAAAINEAEDHAAIEAALELFKPA